MIGGLYLAIGNISFSISVLSVLLSLVGFVCCCLVHTEKIKAINILIVSDIIVDAAMIILIVYIFVSELIIPILFLPAVMIAKQFILRRIKRKLSY